MYRKLPLQEITFFITNATPLVLEFQLQLQPPLALEAKPKKNHNNKNKTILDFG